MDLGLAERFLDLPLTRVPTMGAVVDGTRFTAVDFSTLPGPDDFLVSAPPVRKAISRCGRTSVLRLKAELVPIKTGVPIDVLWFRLPRPKAPPPATRGYVSAKGLVLTLERGDYYQAGTVIPKGRFAQLQEQGLDAFRSRLATVAPPLTDVVGALDDWDQIKLQSVPLNHLPQWHRPGFIAIGDAAHAMSPVFGVGVNYAIQDAVALSNAIAGHLTAAEAPVAVLAQVQSRRQPPVHRMHRIKRFTHRNLNRVMRASGDRLVPRPVVRGLQVLEPLIQRALAGLIGQGFLSERPDLGEVARKGDSGDRGQ